jgi:hypothetical protein
MSNKLTAIMNDCEWLKYKLVAPGGWAMDNEALYTLCYILNNVKPKNILEFGLGQSSKIVHQYSTFYKDVHALTIEHNNEWLNSFCRSIPNDINMIVKQYDSIVIEYKGFQTLTYSNLDEIFGNYYDFIIVDGPYGSEHYSRSQIINIVHNPLPETFCIFIDDAERHGENETIEEICIAFCDKKIEYCLVKYIGEEKQHALICSKNLEFLTSL